MATTYHARPGLNGATQRPLPHEAPCPRRLFRLPLIAAGAGMALLVALDGAWPWRVVRVAFMAALLASADRVLRTRRPGVVVAGFLLGIRAFHGWRRFLAVPVVLMGAYAGGTSVGVSVYATSVPRPELGSRTPADHRVEYIDASFLTMDGIRLSGWYIPSRNRAAVALLHGASSTRSNVLEEAVVLARHGYGVLLFDARGFGRSEGRAMNLGWHGDGDVAAAVSFLRQRPDVDPGRIGAVGSSMGGEQAIGAMAADDRIRAVVAEGATGRVAGDLAWLSDRYGARGWLQERLSALTYAVTDLLTAARPPRTLRAAVAAAAPRPVLLVAAGEKPDEAHAAAFIRQGAPESVEVWVVPGAGHTAGLQTRPAEWTERVTSFFDAALVAPR